MIRMHSHRSPPFPLQVCHKRPILHSGQQKTAAPKTPENSGSTLPTPLLGQAGACAVGGGGGMAQGPGVGVFAFRGAYWLPARAHSDPRGPERVLVVSREPLNHLSFPFVLSYASFSQRGGGYLPRPAPEQPPIRNAAPDQPPNSPAMQCHSRPSLRPRHWECNTGQAVCGPLMLKCTRHSEGV